MSVYKCGTSVTLQGDIPATIIGVSISFDDVTYQVVFWDGRTRKTEWVRDFEINAVATKSPIGFKA